MKPKMQQLTLLFLLLIVNWRAVADAAVDFSKPSSSPTNADVDENSAVGTIVNVDGDATTENLVVQTADTYTWSALTGTGCAANFQVQVDSGNTKQATLRTLQSLDYETTQTYTCTVVVTNTAATDSGTVVITISVNNKIDVTPTFNATSYSCSIDEEEAVGTELPSGCQGFYTDSEVDLTTSPDSVSCSISGTHSAYFTVTHNSGLKVCKPKLNQKLDADNVPTSIPSTTLTFDMTATDSGGLKSTRTVTVTVNDINDNAPVCSPSALSVSVAETFTGAIVSSLSCTDADSGTNGQIEFSLMDPASSRYFAVDSTSGRVTASVPLDYDVSSTSNYTSVVVKVSDKNASPKSTSVTVTISITAENDNSPVWGDFSPAYTDATTAITTVSEGADAGLTIFTAVATDADYGADGVVTFSITSAKGSDLSNLINAFEVNSASGVVSLKTKGALDRETVAYADITIEAKDNPTSSSANTITRVVRVSISDFNEFAPAFVPSTAIYSTTVAEGAAVDTLVLTLDVSDPDQSAAAVTCSIVSGNSLNMFKTDTTNTKLIKVNTAIEPDSPTSHTVVSQLIVSCSDGGLTSSATVTISVSLTNDNTPTLTLPAGTTITLSEDQTLGKIADVIAGDKDAGTDGTFSCSVSPVGTFGFSGSCDQLMLLQTLDRETAASHSLILTIKDGGSPALSATVAVTVTVTDVNDNNPICSPSTYYYTLSETSAAISSMTTVTCSDADTHGIYYSSNTTGFAVDPVTGVVSYTGGADYDTGPSSYQVIIYAIDKNDVNKYAQATVRVTITNVNEYTPTFTNKSVSVTETIYGGQLVTSFVATDTDKSPDDIQTYRITSGDSSSFFSINNNGDIFVQSGRTLDYESLKAAGTTTWTLVVEAQDGGSTVKTGSGTLTISLLDANDNIPVFTQTTFTGTVAEGTGTVTPVTSVSATDADADTTNNFAKVKYSFSTANTYFSIDATSGVVSKTSANLDYNTYQTVSIPVLAVDNDGAGPNTGTATVVITVTDTNTQPTCTTTVTTISNQREDTALGTAIWTLTSSSVCSDADTAQSLKYTLSSDSDSHFSIHPTTGALVLTQSLNYENTTAHYLTILVTDNHATPMSTSIVVTVTVTDVNEFSPNCTVPTSASISEGLATGTTVYNLASCADSDRTTTTFTYSIVSGPPFDVPADGTVTNSAILDYESGTTSYVVQVKVSDNAPSLGGLKTSTYTTTVTVLPVNEVPPVFSTPTTIYADVTESAGSSVGSALTLTLASGGLGGSATISATDSDKGVANHSSVIYSIASGNGNGWFVINPSTGVISIAELLDRETASSATLVVTATDGMGMAATASVSVIVTVKDYNDNPPTFHTSHFTVNVSEGAAYPGTVVDFSSSTILSDADEGSNANMTLQITSGILASPNNQFKISSKLLQTNKEFDLPTDASQFILVVTATDGGLPQLTGTATVTVNIVEVNKVSPTFAKGSDTISMSEDTAVGSTLYNVTATDTDEGLGGTITYSLGTTSPSTSLFSVGGSSGLVLLANAADYDTLTDKTYQLFVVATDSGSPQKSATFTLTVSITDANDNDPVFASSNEFTKSFAENVGTNFAVTTVAWTDADSGTGGTVTCSIVTQTSPAIFSIPSASDCKIVTSSNPDRETRAVYTVQVQLSDGGSPVRTKQAVFTFTLTDLNDNAPVFNVPEVTTSVSESAATGTTVTTVAATDADEGTNAAFTFSMVSNDGGSIAAFTINSATGVITTAATLDRETTEKYSLRVLAIDQGTTPLTGTAIVNVTVTDVNDNTPTWVSAPYTASVSEGASIGTLVTTVTATDLDSTFGVLTYSIISGDTLGLFRINNGTGRVETAKSSGLNRESVSTWTLTLQVQDNGSPTPNSATTSLTITVTDVNEFAPSWVNSSYNFHVIENSPVGTSVGTVTASDEDDGPLNNKITYSIDAYLQGNAYFSIDSSTAAITVGVASLDRETQATYLLRIVASDAGTPPKTATNCLTVTVYIDDANDNDPAFASSYYNSTVQENVTVGYNVLTVTGSDLDTGDNAVLIYRINTSSSAGAFASYFFNLDSSTGLLTVKNSLDYENTTFFNFPILIYDNGTTPQRSSSASVYIVITDVNDVAPTLSSSFYNAEVPEVDDGNMQIVTISATDPDTGTGGSVEYFWNSNTPYFYVDSTTGIVTRNTLNSIESYKIYTQDVVAKDQGNPQLTSSTSKVRIDTFPAADYIVMITFSMSESDYLSYLSTIKTNLAKTLVGKYPNNRVGHWKYHMYSGNVVGYFYALANTNTDNITYITIDKEYVPYTDLLAFWRFDSSGTPTAVLKGSDFTSTPIVKVEPYPQAASTPWYQTWWGILLLTLAGLAAAALLAACVYGLYVCISALCAPKPQALPTSPTVKPPPIRERQILELNKDKHPRHHPKPKGRYLIKEGQGQNKGAQQTSGNRTTTPRADFDRNDAPKSREAPKSPERGKVSPNDGRVSPTGSVGGNPNDLDF